MAVTTPRVTDRKCAEPGCTSAPRWSPDGTRHAYCPKCERKALAVFGS